MLNVGLKRLTGFGLVLVCLYLLPTACISYVCYPLIQIQASIIDPIKRNYAQDQTAYEQLRAAYDQLLQQQIQVQATQDYLRDTRELTAFNKRYTDERLVGHIIERYCGADEQYILIDKGAKDGIGTHDIVLYKDMLVGKVTDIYPWYCRCMLLTDQRCKVAGYCAGTQACGVVQGMNSKQLRMLHVSHLSGMQQGDMIISSGHGTIFPRGFGIARVDAANQHDMVYDVICTPLVDINAITYCSILAQTQ